MCGWEGPETEAITGGGSISLSVGKSSEAVSRTKCGRAASMSELVILDVENDMERSRRLEEEFQSKLERERFDRNMIFALYHVSASCE